MEENNEWSMLGKVMYTFIPNVAGSKRPENGRRYLIQYWIISSSIIEIASAQWSAIDKKFIYDAMFFVGTENPQMKDSTNYRLLGWAMIIKDWSLFKDE